MNNLSQDGWEYLCADPLPCDERVELTGSKTTFQNVLVFRRVIEAATELAPALLSAVAEMPSSRLVLSAAEAPEGVAPALGPANPSLAVE